MRRTCKEKVTKKLQFPPSVHSHAGNRGREVSDVFTREKWRSQSIIIGHVLKEPQHFSSSSLKMFIALLH